MFQQKRRRRRRPKKQTQRKRSSLKSSCLMQFIWVKYKTIEPRSSVFNFFTKQKQSRRTLNRNENFANFFVKFRVESPNSLWTHSQVKACLQFFNIDAVHQFYNSYYHLVKLESSLLWTKLQFCFRFFFSKILCFIFHFFSLPIQLKKPSWLSDFS